MDGPASGGTRWRSRCLWNISPDDKMATMGVRTSLFLLLLLLLRLVVHAWATNPVRASRSHPFINIECFARDIPSVPSPVFPRRLKKKETTTRRYETRLSWLKQLCLPAKEPSSGREPQHHIRSAASFADTKNWHPPRLSPRLSSYPELPPHQSCVNTVTNQQLSRSGQKPFTDQEGQTETGFPRVHHHHHHDKIKKNIHNRNAHKHGNLANIHPVGASQPTPCISVFVLQQQQQQQQQPGGQRQSGRGRYLFI
jgi:hypothetical protein